MDSPRGGVIACEHCSGEFGDRHAMLAHALRSHPLENPWPIHLRPFLTAAQRRIISKLIEKEADCWEKDLVKKLVEYHSASCGAEEWKLPRPTALWLVKVLVIHEHPGLPTYYAGGGMTL